MNILRVMHDGEYVGKLAINDRQDIRFQYDGKWLENGFPLAPLGLPFTSEVQASPHPDMFDRLHGPFYDSLPDGWGLLLMDRAFKSQKGLDPHQITTLMRLAYIGRRGMGALEYEPEILADHADPSINLAQIAENIEQIMSGESAEVLERLRIDGGSPGGARPKVAIAFSEDMKHCISGASRIPDDYSHWIVKFRSDPKGPNGDPMDAGRIEAAYADMARAAGIDMPKTSLIPILARGREELFFAVKRFDRDVNRKIHMLSASGMLYASHRMPSLDYDEGVLQSVAVVTKSKNEIEKAFKVMLFNVLAHNKDDHAKNFAFLFDRRIGTWKFSPAFDLTFNHGMNGHHSTSIHGSTRPHREDIQKVAKSHRLSRWNEALDQVRAATTQWAFFASQYGLSRSRTLEIQKALEWVDKNICHPSSPKSLSRGGRSVVESAPLNSESASATGASSDELDPAVILATQGSASSPSSGATTE